MEYLILLRLLKLPLSTLWWMAGSTYSWTYWLLYGKPETAEEKMAKRLVELEEQNVESRKEMQEEIKLLHRSLTLLREQIAKEKDHKERESQ